MKMLKLFTLSFLTACFFINMHASGQKKHKIGLMVMATGKYIQFVEPLIQSADTYFCKNHEVYYFIFTDGIVPEHPRIIRIEQKKLGWPYDTMMRFATYYKSRELLSGMDYLFATDADMEFVGEIGDEILGPLVGTRHPGYVGNKGTPETNPYSTAYVKPQDIQYYFCGGFYGGKTEEVLKLLRTTSENIETDLAKGYIAIWHDESHINRYFVNNRPTIVLSPSYCYDGSYVSRWEKPYPPKLVALRKNHAQMRN